MEKAVYSLLRKIYYQRDKPGENMLSKHLTMARMKNKNLVKRVYKIKYDGYKRPGRRTGGFSGHIRRFQCICT